MTERSQARALTLIDAEAMDTYPISASERLDSHYFIQWNLKRWRSSEFRLLADPEVGWFGLQLFFEAHDGTPVGTIPADDRLLARMLGISLEDWQRLLRREPGPLHNWSPVRCDNGEVRLAHPVVTEVAVEALTSRRRAQADTAARARAKRIRDLRVMIEERIGAGQLLRDPAFLDAFNDWLEERYPDTQRREAFIRDALGEYQMELAR